VKCPACGYDATVPSPVFDEHARRVRAYLERTLNPASATELHRELGIPSGTFYNRWFRARLHREGIRHAKHGRATVFYSEMVE
jgi:hypothetical protein